MSIFSRSSVTDLENDDKDDHYLDNLLVCSTIQRSDTDDNDEDVYVPESLASFVQAFDTALEDAKQNFFESATTPENLKQETSPSRHHSTTLDDSDWIDTPFPNPANHFTASAAKRELQIDTNPRSTTRVPVILEVEQLVPRLMKSPAFFSTTKADQHTGDSSREAVVPIGDINDAFSPIANLASPLCDSSSPHATRQKLFHSPGSEKKLQSPDRAKSIRETVETAHRQTIRSKTPANVDTAMVDTTRDNSSHLRSAVETSASKRRTQFTKARKSIALKRAGSRQKVAIAEESEVAHVKPVHSIPLSLSKQMKRTTFNQAKVESELSSMSSAKTRSTVGQPMATTIRDSLNSRDVTASQPQVSKHVASSTKGGSKEMLNRQKEYYALTQSNPTKKLTLDEKIAATRERARLRNQEKEALLIARMALKSKLSPSLSIQPLEGGRLERPVPNTIPANSKGRPERQKVTIPQSPKFATNSKLGARRPASSVSVQISLSQRTDVLKKGLRSQEPISTCRRRAGLTIPKTPKFATDSRPNHRFFTPTSRAGIATLAQSNDIHRKGLRTMTAPVLKRPSGLTIPKSPKFQTTTKRELPKSTAEKEAEIMSYYKSHPFKAGPIMKEFPQEKSKAKLPPRPLTSSAPFRSRINSRGVTSTHQPVVMKKQDDEAQFKFHARPMPDFFQHSTNVVCRKSHIKPIPFHLLPSPIENFNDESKVKEAPFRAKPVPKTTYEYHPPPRTPPRTTSDSKSPNLATGNRSTKHDAIIQSSRARAEALSAEKEANHKARQRHQLKEALKKADLVTPRSVSTSEKIKPFVLQSTQRHVNYVQEMEEKKKQENEERLKQREFHARSFHPTPTPKPIHSPRSPTQLEPFNVSGMDSVDAENETARKKLLLKAEERKAKAHNSPFKARPVPSTTYVSPSGLVSRSPQVSSGEGQTPTRASPSTNEVAESLHDDSISEISDTGDSNDDEIEIEFVECQSPEDDNIGQFLSA